VHRVQEGDLTAVPQAIANGPMPYRRRRPERTLLYRTVQTHFATWLALTRDSAVDSDRCRPTSSASSAAILECGILALASPALVAGSAGTTS